MNTTKATIRIESAGKRFKDVWVFRNVSVSFYPGKIYGLIGRNGSGKTMLMKCVSGLSHISEGAIYVNDQQVGVTIDVPESIGGIIEVPGFLPNLSGFANLKYLARLKNRIDDKTIKENIHAVGLDPESKKHVGKYSLGMRQRLGIAQALMEDPDILLLDEPMNGLDSQGIQNVKALLRKLRAEGKTIILASHYAEDVDELCDTVFRLEAGVLSKDDR